MDPATRLAAAGRPRGRYKSRLDDKGRLKLPTDFHEHFKRLGVLRVFITTLGDRVARIYPDWVWDEVETELRKPSEQGEALEAVLFTAQDLGGNAEIDNQGRVTFNPELRAELGLENATVHLILMGQHVQVMSDAEYQLQKASHAENVAAGVKLVKTMGLP